MKSSQIYTEKRKYRVLYFDNLMLSDRAPFLFYRKFLEFSIEEQRSAKDVHIFGRKMYEETMKMEKRRRVRKGRVFILCLAVCTVLFAGGKMIGIVMDFFSESGISQFGTAKSKYANDIAAPVSLSKDDIQTRLQELAKEHPEFLDIYNHSDEYSKKILSVLCNNPEMIDFVKDYNGAKNQATGGIKKSEISNGIPLLLQWDKRWGYVEFGDNVMGLSGCAPTCLSMVVAGLTGDTDISPDKVAKFITKNGYYVEGTGTAWSVMTEGVQEFNIEGREMSLDKNSVFEELKNGHPIICSVRPGDFTTSGHFIVLTEIKNGKIKVNDPNSSVRSRVWSYDALEGQIKNLWSFQEL